MQNTNIPYKFATVWASAGTYTATIPATAAGAAASQAYGFPSATAMPVASGGTPPTYADFNGLGYYLAAWAQWQQAGAPVFYDATLSAAINGYPNGARLAQASVPGQLWMSTVDNNTSDPDTGGANWIDPFAVTSSANGRQVVSGRTVMQWQGAAITLAGSASTDVQVLTASPAFPNKLLAVFPNGGAIASGGDPAPFAVGANVSGNQTAQYVVTNLGTDSGSATVQFLLIGY